MCNKPFVYTCILPLWNVGQFYIVAELFLSYDTLGIDIKLNDISIHNKIP